MVIRRMKKGIKCEEKIEGCSMLGREWGKRRGLKRFKKIRIKK